jgi:DNA modification methylase
MFLRALPCGLQKDGWINPHRYTWNKGRALPKAGDRLRPSSETILGFVKQNDYDFFDKEIRVEHADKGKQPNLENVIARALARPQLTDPEKADCVAKIQRRHADGLDYRPRYRGDKATHRDGQGEREARGREIEKHGFYFHDFHPDGAMPGDVLYFPPAPSDPVHPCPFPVELAEWCIKASCREGGRVLDLFMGSGTTAVAAKNLGRDVVGFDPEQRFIDRAWERLGLPVPAVEHEPDHTKETAYHEAGHAFLHYHFHIPVESIDVYRPKDFVAESAMGRVSAAQEQFVSRGDRDTILNVMMVCLAGPCAQARFTGKSPDTRGGDAEQALKLAGLLSKHRHEQGRIIVDCEKRTVSVR